MPTLRSQALRAIPAHLGASDPGKLLASVARLERPHVPTNVDYSPDGPLVNLFEIHPSIIDPEMRRQSRLLSICLAVLTPSFFCIDVLLSLATPNHKPPLIGYLFLTGTFLLNRAGRYRLAAMLVIAMFSLVGLGQVFLGTSSVPIATLHYVSLGPMLGAIFLSMRSVFVLTALNVTGVALASRFAPAVSAGGAAIIGPLSMNVMVGVLASVYLYHRNGVEADRRRVLLGEIEERKQLEDRLRQAQKMEALGKFAGGIAHDFNNMLMVIMGNVALISRRTPSPEAQQIESAVSSAASLTRQLLAFGRRAVIEPTVLDVGHVVGDAVTMMRRIIGESIQIDHSLPSTALLARLDRAQLEQVLLNLATNARDAMPGGGTLRISASEVDLRAGSARLPLDTAPGEYICLQVSDSGVGMDEATQQRAFEPFFTTKPRGRGTGLGLATVFGIVTQSGGFIRVSSQPGKGTRFELFFPRSTHAVQASSMVVEAAVTRGVERVLIVEDDDGVRAIVSMILSEAGYEVIRAASLREARAIWQNESANIALVITDMVLSDGDGLDFAGELRKRQPQLPVLCMSGYAEREGFENGSPGFSHLQKPFSAEDLLGRTRGLIDQAAARSQHVVASA
jgi:signal transduction histidine kinase